MKAELSNFFLVIPQLILLVMACVVLLSGVIFKKIKYLPYSLAQLTLIVVTLVTWLLATHLSMGHPLYAFDQTVVVDRLALLLMLLVYVSTFAVFMIARRYNVDVRLPQVEFYVLALLSVLGMTVLITAHNFITLYLGLELLSLPIYALVALARAQVRCLEAAMKYFIFGAIASGLLLYGFSIVFGLTHSLDLSIVAARLGTLPASETIGIVFSLVFVIAGIGFKLGLVPFHMWLPDVYDGATNSVTLFISTVPKVAAFALLARLLLGTFGASVAIQWQHLLIVMAVLSLGLGNIVAIAQTNIKRMLAYSSISHMGFMVLGFCALNVQGFSAAFFYLLAYVLMTLVAFGVLVILSKHGHELLHIDELQGLHHRNPWIALLLLMVMFSFAGIPPFIGFIAKLMILTALVKAHFVGLAVYAILLSVVGAYYYIRVVKVMYFAEPDAEQAAFTTTIDGRWAVSIVGILLLVIGIFPMLIMH